MYFNDDGKTISSKIKSYNELIAKNFFNIHFAACASSKTEVQYFRKFFPEFEKYLNSLHLPGVSFQCKTREIHSSPMVTFGAKKTCELGDYFIIVKYKINNLFIGKKVIVYQLKRSHSNSWGIHQTQLNLLKNWPTFKFGRTSKGANSFTLRPTRPEYGSFVLVNDLHHMWFCSNLFGTAYDIYNNQKGKVIKAADADLFYYSGVISYLNLLIWEIGEPIIKNTDIADFTSALYRYMEWKEDPPNEFVNYEKKGDGHAFWGIEITVNAEGESHG